MAANLIAAYPRPGFHGAVWMSPPDQTEGLAKLARSMIGLGYPDSWIDFRRSRWFAAEPWATCAARRPSTVSRNLGQAETAGQPDRLAVGSADGAAR